MPDGRFLSKSIAYSAQVAAVSFEADFLFTRMIPFADREGRIVGSAKAVKGMCCPLRDEMSVKVIQRALGELAGVQLITWYRVDDAEYVQFPGFPKHQRGARLDREATSKIPAPDAASAEQVRPARRTVRRNHSGVSTELGRVSEVKGSKAKSTEVKRSEGSIPSLAAVARSDAVRLATVCAEIAERLPTENGRTALGEVVDVAENKIAALFEIKAILDGMRGKFAPEAVDLALCDYVSNGFSGGRFNALHFRRHVERAAVAPRPVSAGNEGDLLDNWAKQEREKERIAHG